MASKKVNISEYHLNRNQPDKPQLAMYDIADYLRNNQDKAMNPHIHSFYQIIWFRAGTGKHFVDFHAYDVYENAIFFIAKNQVHYFDAGTHYQGVMIHFNEPFLLQNDTRLDFMLKSSLFNNPYQQPSCCIGQDLDRLLDQYVQQMITELQNQKAFGQEELLRVYLKAFLIQVHRRKNENEKSSQQLYAGVYDKRLQLMEFVNLLDENYNKGFTVKEYAVRMHISTRSLSELTSQLLNKSPLQMIQERIILEAQRLLLHSNLKVGQVGYRLGFDDPSYFVKYFKKHTDMSPSDFRKSINLH